MKNWSAKNMKRLEGKVSIVTGGASGIGEAICTRFTEEGAKVLVADLDFDRASHAAENLRKYGADAAPCKVDVSDPKQVQEMVRAALDRYGAIDILVNCAGIAKFTPTEQLTVEEWQKTIDVNLNGVFYCCHSVAREMIERKSGKIINISSMAGIVGVPNLLSYVASKHGVVGITRALAVDLAKYRINVNCICPGTTLTPLNLRVMSKEYLALRSKAVPLGRLAEPMDQANAAVFLASSESDYITGLIMYVDGGMYSLFSGYAAEIGRQLNSGAV